MFTRILDTLTTCQSQDRINVQTLIGQDTRGTLDLTGLQLAPQYHEDVTVLTLMSHPVLIFIIRDG